MKYFIILFFTSITSLFAQKNENYQKFYDKGKNNLCSSTIILNNDSTYLYERGCEGQSYLNYGIWKKIGRKINFQSLNLTGINLIKSKTFEDAQKKDSITIIFKDKYNEPIKNFLIAPYYPHSNYYFETGISISPLTDSLPEMSGKEYKALFDNLTDENGEIKILKKDLQKIELTDIFFLTGERIYLDVKEVQVDFVEIRLKINALAFYYQVIKTSVLKESSLKITPKGLKSKAGIFLLRKN